MVFSIGIQLQAQTQSPLKALSFDGVNDYVSGTGISTSLTAFTIEAWVYHNTLPAVVQRYITINPEVAVLRYDGTIYGGTNALHFYIKKANGSLSGFLVENVLTTGTWMHVAGTYDGTTMKLYLNGTLIKSASPAGGLYPPSGSFSFSAGGSEAFNGKMDEVSVWNYARPVTDIRQDMYQAAPTGNANLINYWKFNNGTGITLTDSKGTANGTLNNMNNSNWIASTIPFAAGAVNTQIVSTTGTKTFTGTGLTMNFTAKSGTDTIVASRIDTLPNTSPTGVSTVFNSQYWVVKRFGTGTFTSNLTFTLSEDLTTADESLPANIRLYARADNSDAGWTLLASATSVNAANNTATFNGITGFSQFIVVRNCTPPTIISQSTAAQTKTKNGTFNPITVTATGTNLTYQWFKNASAVNSGGTSLGSDYGAQTYSYTPQATTVGTLYYYCTVSGSCGAAQTSSVSGAFIVNPYTGTYSGGTGSSGDPYQIATLGDLIELSEYLENWNTGKHFIQTADIDATSTNTLNSGAGFSPIGNFSIEFQGTYNGQNHTISNLYISRSSTDNVGLFGYIANSGAGVNNLGLITANITGHNRVGGLAGGLAGTGTNMSNNYTTGSVSGVDYVGGIVGEFYSGAIDSCYSKANVNGNSRVAGLVAYKNGGTLSNSHSTGNVNGNNTVSGLVGKNSGTISNCYATGNITGSGPGVGGLVAVNSGTISNCYASGSVAGSGSSNYVGGLIGSHEGVEISNCYATGNVSGNDYVGGLNGLNVVPANNCYSTGSVSGNGSNIGGLMGSNEGDGEVNNCFWDTETSGKSS